MNKTNDLLLEKNEFKQLKVLLAEKNLEIERLKQENSLLRRMFDCLPGRVFCKDKQGTYLFSNRHNTKRIRTYVLEKTKIIENFQGKTEAEIFPTEIAETLRQDDLEVIRTHKNLQREYIFHNIDGKCVTELVNRFPIYDDNSQILAVMGYCFDITYLKSLEAKVKNAGLAKIEFIRHMQHDIKTPFTGIMGVTNILLSHEADPEKRAFLKDITLCANELMGYCDRILDFSKAAVKDLPLVVTAFKLHELVESVINIASPVAKIKQLNLLLDYAESLPHSVMGYPYRLKSILVNLLNNALQFTQQGQIYLLVKPKTVVGKSIIAQFVIKDTGEGLSHEKQMLIEKQFNATSILENDTYEGNGLGLRIVSQFAKDIGGTIALESELGKGTTFTLEIPLKGMDNLN